MTAEHLALLGDFGGLAADAADPDEFVAASAPAFADPARADILARALKFALQSGGAPAELSFLGLFAALESTLTYFRREGEYTILPDADFARLEADLKSWLRRHPLLEGEGARRGLVYEKVRELNRIPFSRVFRGFCERHALDLSDLWPLAGAAEEWPLMEIRHRLVHGDPFTSRPPEAIACAREHLRWTVERMILSALGWPVARSRASAERLARGGRPYAGWREERARLA